MKYYYPNGKEIGSFAEFVDFYSKLYYYLCPDMELEKEIDKILSCPESKKLDIDDVKNIFMWKTNVKKETVTGNTIKTRYGKIDLKKVREKIKCVEKIETKDEKDIEKIFEKLKGDGIGTVYAITAIYFLKRGEYPIYDKFAHVALKALQDEDNLFDKDGYLLKLFPDGSIESFSSYIKNFKDPLTTMLQEAGLDYKAYKSDRNIDRALWVYGHLFNKTERNKKRMRE